MWGLVGDGEAQVVMALGSGASLAQMHVNVGPLPTGSGDSGLTWV